MFLYTGCIYFELGKKKKRRSCIVSVFQLTIACKNGGFVGSCLHAAGKGRKILNRLLTYVIVFILCGKC